ncbi:MAG: ribose-phosphate diphosphokinase [Rhodospirillaceae bacterium]|nr:ribose-phosphate diphosphokinase [Rhodospirillaceae bacterium]
MKPVVLGMPYSRPLADQLTALLGAEAGEIEVRHFPDGDSYVRVVGGSGVVNERDAIIVATLDRPDDKILPVWFLADTLREFHAARVGLVCPYLPYMRQDRRFKDGEAITSVSFAQMMSRHVDWMVTVDPHLHRHKSLSAIYGVRTEVVHAAPLVSDWIRGSVDNPLIIGPDEESEQWVASVARAATAPYIVQRKRRSGDRSVAIEMPDTQGYRSKTPVVVDDIISTAHTMIETVKELRRRGMKPPICVGVHGIFAGDAFTELERAGAVAIVTSNTVNHESNRIDIGNLLLPAIHRMTAASQ